MDTTHEWRKSLDDLEGVWGASPKHATYLIQKCHALHAKPLIDLSDEELRLCLSQKLGLKWVLPLVMLRLQENPLRSGEMYEGDVLANALRLPVQAWSGHENLREDLGNLASTLLALPPGDDFDPDLLTEAFDDFNAA